MKKYLTGIVLLSAVLLGITGLSMLGRVAPAPSATTEATITLSVEGVYTDRTVPITEGETALAVLEALDTEDANLRLRTKSYSGLGVLVTGMGELENGAGAEYWQYTVNGVMPQIGADQYQLANGDAVSWFFAESSE